MLTSEQLKNYAIEKIGVDAIGIANIERYKDAPLDMHPLSVMPRAKSVIVYTKRILRGPYRGIDEGTHWLSYGVYGYTELNRLLVKTAYNLCRYIESFGYEAVPMTSGGTTRELGPRGPLPAPGKPRRDVSLHQRIAGVLAGLGEIGWSKVFLSEQFGPRQRLGVVLTELELEPDPIQVGKICDNCKCCVVECPGGAIPKDKKVAIEVEGHKIEWADIDLGKCKLTHFGLTRKTCPYLVKHFPGFYLPIAQQEVTWREAWDLGWAMFSKISTFSALSGKKNYDVPAICGSRGCIIGCLRHLETRGKVKNTFRTKKIFSRQKPWYLSEKPDRIDHHGFIYDPVKNEYLFDRDKNADESSGWY